jgi:threonine dehydrogenase-like Zn-dependent dehydrogenase
MLATILHGARDVRCEEVSEPKIQKPADAIIRLSASCICGSDLWPFRGLNDVKAPMAMGHEYCGIVEEVGSAVKTVHPGQFVVEQVWLANGFTAILVTHDVAEAREAASPSSARRQSAS